MQSAGMAYGTTVPKYIGTRTYIYFCKFDLGEYSLPSKSNLFVGEERASTDRQESKRERKRDLLKGILPSFLLESIRAMVFWKKWRKEKRSKASPLVQLEKEEGQTPRDKNNKHCGIRSKIFGAPIYRFQ